MSQKLLLVDKNDNLVGFSDIESAHTGKGKRHRAFVTVLFDSKGRVLTQKRKHRLFDGLWDLTAISHNLRKNGRDESYQEASDRALKREMGISRVPIRKIGGFNYFARDGKNCENEYCAILVGKYDGKIKPNIKEVYGTKSVLFGDFIKDATQNPNNYTPWARLATAKIKNTDLGNFKKELDDFLVVFESYASNFFSSKIKTSANYPPLISRFYKDLGDYSYGGKRLRGFLAWLGYRLGGGRDIKRIREISLALELLHSFLLIHDDIIDDSDIRRGKATIHKRYEKYFDSHYGLSQAIIIGDIVCFEAIKLINESKFAEDIKKQVLAKALDILLETGYGEALDVEYSHKKVNLSKIMQMTTLKTAKYTFAGPLLIGAISAGTNKIMLSALESFAINVGTVFQMQDDILGVFGDEKILGKSILSDMKEGKNTILIYKVRELASRPDRRTLDRLWGNQKSQSQDLQKVRRIIEKSGALSWCEKEKQRLAKKAKGYIKNITADLYFQGMLEELVDFAGSREN